MSFIKSEVLSSVRSSKECKDASKSNCAQLPIKLEGAAPPQPSIVAFLCEYCTEEFSLKQRLIEHVNNIHGHQSKSCKPEQLQFYSSAVGPIGADLNASVNTSISSLRDPCSNPQRTTSSRNTFDCHVCQKTFKYRCNLTTHLRIHSEERPYTCSVCRKTFKLKCNLNKHLRTIHSEERP
eukprot:98781_1